MGVCARSPQPIPEISPHGNLVYLLYLQYNASVSISNFETQVSISHLAAVRASSCVCSARCREKMNTTRTRDSVALNRKTDKEVPK